MNLIKAIYKRILSEKLRIQIIEFFRLMKAPLYYGDNFYCNVCDKSFKQFFPKGNFPRSNAQCPYCSSLERTRVLDLYLAKELDLYNQSNISVLHFAPESGLFKKINKIKQINYIDGDINPAYARYKIDITDIPYPDNSFDYIICSHVLGHVPDENQAIRELYRVAKSDAEVLVLSLLSACELTNEDASLTKPADRLQVYGEADLCRLHGNDFSNRLRAGGFKVDEIDYRLNFSSEIQQKYSLGDGRREKIFRCVKS